MRLARIGAILLSALFPVTASAITAEQLFSGFAGAPIHIKSATSYRVNTGRERDAYHSGVASRTARLQEDRHKIVQEITSSQALQKALVELSETCSTSEASALANCITYGDALLDHLIDMVDIVNSDYDTSSAIAQYVNLSEITLVRLLQGWHTSDFFLRQDKFGRCNTEHLSMAEGERTLAAIPTSPLGIVELFHLVLFAEAQSPEEATFCLWISPTDAQLAKLRNTLWTAVGLGKVRTEAKQLCRAKRAGADEILREAKAQARCSPLRACR